jgi:hypothetical protein
MWSRRSGQGASSGDVIATEMDPERLPIRIGIMEVDADQLLAVNERRMPRENQLFEEKGKVSSNNCASFVRGTFGLKAQGATLA